MKRISIFLFAVVFITSCKDKDKLPSGILKPEKMQAVLWDVIKANAFTTEFIRTDSAKIKEAENFQLQQKIFTIHKVSKTEFYNSFDYYKANPTLFKKILDSMIANANKTKNFNLKPLQVE